MTISIEYSPAFYAGQVQGSCSSASRVVPVIIELLHPTTVLDVGCGLGAWLSEFSKAGCCVCGVDGNYIDQSLLRIPGESFVRADLEECVRDCRIPGRTGDRFSLCLSLEVAEHLAPSMADGFVRLLTHYSDCVLFSAAIPHQGGAHHVNLQWPDYWIARFAAMDYKVLDIIRPRIWEDQSIEPWYRQNTLLFMKNGCALANQAYAVPQESRLRRIVHPDYYLRKVDYWNSPASLGRYPSGLLFHELINRATKGVNAFLKWPLRFLRKNLSPNNRKGAPQ